MKIKLLGISFLLFMAMTPFMESKASYQESYEEAKVDLLNNVGRYEQHSLMIEGLSESKIAAIADKFSASYEMDYLGISGTVYLSPLDSVLEIYKAFPMYIDNFIPLEKASVTGRTTKDPKDEPYYASQGYFNTINIGDTWSKTKGDKITVAVIDTGIYYNHQDFYDENGNTIISPKSINISENKVVEDNGNDYSVILDGSFHGTSVASFIAAQVNGLGMTGVAPDVELLVIKANTESDGMTFVNAYHLINGISYAVANGADIINMSFGSYGSNIYASQIDAAIAKGVTLIAAAGNETTADPSYPVSDPDVIGAGALASNSLQRADFSNFGKDNLTVMAPGESVLAAYSNSEASYAWVGGTSFSSPIVAGVAALYKSLYPSTSPSEMFNLFAASATDLGTAGFDEDFGYGVVDVETLIDGEKGTITYNYLDSQVSNVTRKFIRGHTLQMEPDTTSNGKDIEGWYYDQEFALPYNAANDILNEDVEIYAKYVSTEVIPVEGVSLDNTSLTMSVGETQTLTASVTPSNASDKSLTWASSDETVASVSNGAVRALKAGTTTISVTTNDGDFVDSCLVTVNEALLAQSVTSSFTSVSWASSDNLWTSRANGGAYDSTRSAVQVTKAATGAGAISKNEYNNVSSVSIKLAKSSKGVGSVDIKVGDTSLTPDKTTISTTVSEYTYKGNALLSGQVSFEVTCTTSSIYVYSITINYMGEGTTIPIESITLSPTSASLKEGETTTLVASISPDNATNKELIWSSSDESVATVDQNGLVSAIKEGNAIISVTDTSLSVSASANISVTSAYTPTPEVGEGYIGSFKNATAGSGYAKKDGFTLTGATGSLAWSSGVAQCASNIFYQGHNNASNAAKGNTSYTETFESKLDNILTLSGTYKNYIKMDSSIANASGIRIAYTKADSSDFSGYIIYSLDGGSSWVVGNSYSSISTGGGEFNFNFVSATADSLGSNVMFALVYSTSATQQRIQLSDVEIQLGQAVDGAVSNVINLINAIGEINESNYSSKNASIIEARDAYNALLDSQKAQVTNYDLLVSSINQYDAYDFISFYRGYRIDEDICWLLSNVEEYEFLIGMYDILEVESKAIVDNTVDIDGVTIGETIAYLKSLHAYKASEIPTLNAMPSESVSSYSTFVIIAILALSTMVYITVRKQRQ